MSNYFPEDEEVVGGPANEQQDTNEDRERTGSTDPGRPDDALEPLDAEERMELEQETEEMIHHTGGQHEGQAPEGGRDLPDTEKEPVDAEEDMPRTGTDG